MVSSEASAQTKTSRMVSSLCVYSCCIIVLCFQFHCAQSLVSNGLSGWRSRHSLLAQRRRLGVPSEQASNAAQKTLATSSTRRRDQELEQFLRHFQGEFDNYGQVVDEWQQEGLRPREGGGHEHMHCRLVPLSNTTRIACFYLDGNPQTIFRLRYYAVHAFSKEECSDARFTEPFAYQHIYTLHPQLEGAIRKSSPDTWGSVVLEHLGLSEEDDDDDDDDTATIHHEQLVAAGAVQYLNDCDVIWSTTPHPVLHTYCSRQQQDDDAQFHALLLAGDEIVVPSQYDPNTQIRIKDQLSLFADTLYIHDRGRDATTNAWLYGNRRGVPYILQRTSDQDWTATGDYDAAGYHSRMEAMGGPTAAAPRRRRPVATAVQRNDDGSDTGT